MNYFKKRKLQRFLDHLNNENIKWPEGYLEIHKDKIDLINWLISSYNGLTISTPEEYLKYLLSPVVKHRSYHFEKIIFLYHWVHYNKITGF